MRLHIKPAPVSTNPSGDDEPQAPSVVLGPDYAGWVRTRITSQTHRIPTHGFDQGTVLKICDSAARQVRRRTATLVAVVLGALVTMLLKWLTFDAAAAAALVGCWATYLMDRYASQRRMNAVLDSDLPKAAVEPPSYALPYVREMRKGTPRDRFLGAGLQAWPQAAIGIDVEPAPPGQEDETTPPVIPNPTRSTKSDELAAVLSAISKIGNQSTERKPMKPFTSAQLHAYVVKRLSNPAPSHDRSHPVPRIDIVGIAGISRKRWTTLDEAAWRGLRSLALNDGVSRAPDSDTARRYIWARITKSNGELIVSEGGMRPDARFFVSCGTSGQVVATSVDYGRGWVNKPGSVSVRIPRSVSRLSLRRTLLMLLGATGRSIASHTCRARSGWSAAVNTAMICW